MTECFVVMSDEIGGRLDVGYFLAIKNPEYLKVRSSKYPIKKLGEISTLVTKGESPLWRGDSFLPAGIPFLRGKNIKNGNIDFSDVVYVSEKVHNRMKRSILNDNFLLLTMAGTLGDVAFFRKDCLESNINQDIAKIKLTKEISYEYAEVYFQTDFAKSQINVLSNGGTRSHLNFQQIKSFDVILPRPEVQSQIVSLIKKANKLKESKEVEALKLLDSTSDYVLDELEIKLPELKNKVVYLVDSEEVQNKRVDAYYYQPKFEEVEKAMKKAKFEVKELKEFAKVNDKLENIKNYKEINYIDLTSINKTLGRIQEINQLNSEEAPSRARQKLEKGDLLVSGLSGSLKSIAIFDKSEPNFIASTGFYIIKNSKNYNNHYLFALFRSFLYQLLLHRETTGAIMSSINREALLNLKIPLPPLAVQNKIAEEVKKRMQKAESLQKEAKEELEKAKLEVEKVILG